MKYTCKYHNKCLDLCKKENENYEWEIDSYTFPIILQVKTYFN